MTAATEGEYESALLQRSILQLLYPDGITSSALRMFVTIVESYMAQLCEDCVEYGRVARRRRPVIADIEQMIQHRGIRLAALERFLALPIMPIPFEQMDDDEGDGGGGEVAAAAAPAADTLLGPLLQSNTKPVYNHLPPLPPTFTFIHTPVYVDRPTSPKQIRELATAGSKGVQIALKKLITSSTADTADTDTADTAAASGNPLLEQVIKSL